MKLFSHPVRTLLITVSVMVFTGITTIAGAYLYFARDLPSPDSLKEVRFQVPLRVYTQSGKLIAEFGEKKRIPLEYEQFPEDMIKAILAAEDDRFFEHPGVDYHGLLRAAVQMIMTGEKKSGGSTITMQVARNFFLTRKKTITRKLREIFLALEIENKLTKQEILSLYLNKIYLGHRSYGVAAASQVYYGKPLDQLTTPQLAMIAGLPKAPSRYNPITNPERALIRRNYVLRRMLEIGYLDQAKFTESIQTPVTARLHSQNSEVEAPYLAEMVRAELYTRFGKETYTEGFKVFTTLDETLQESANLALRQTLVDYEHRHGYRGAEGQHELGEESQEAEWHKILLNYSIVGGMEPALVLATEEQLATIYMLDGEKHQLEWPGMLWARSYIDENRMGPEPKLAKDILKRGDIIRIWKDEQGNLQLGQIPEVAGALVSLSPTDGSVIALVGGFDYYHSKFNRVTQAERQPGSNFKPFVYSAGLEKGFTAASLINDAPVVFDDDNLESEWRPENYSGRFYGPTRLRIALYNSRNLVSVRLLRNTGIGYTIRHVKKFGFTPEKLPRDLSLALGSASLTPFEVVKGYAVLANGGFLIEPYFIERIEDNNGTILVQAEPLVACLECEKESSQPANTIEEKVGSPEKSTINTITQVSDDPAAEMPPLEELQTIKLAPRTIPPQNIYLITSMLQDVIKRGTGRKALQLKRHDLAGKTGTTNEQRDAWFSGFNSDIVTTTWVGFDNPRPMGRRETGGRAALPMWIRYMGKALEDIPEKPIEQPPGLITVRIDPETGELATAETNNAIFEIFREENAPEAVESVGIAPGGDNGNTTDNSSLTEQLF